MSAQVTMRQVAIEKRYLQAHHVHVCQAGEEGQDFTQQKVKPYTHIHAYGAFKELIPGNGLVIQHMHSAVLVVDDILPAHAFALVHLTSCHSPSLLPWLSKPQVAVLVKC